MVAIIDRFKALWGVLFQEASENVVVQLFRYGIVGGISFIGDFGTLYALTEFLSCPYLLSASIGFCIGLTINYLLSIVWVFNRKSSGSRAGGELLGWLVIGLVGLGLNALIMWFFTELMNMYYLGSKIVSTIIVFAWNFFARRFLVSKI